MDPPIAGQELLMVLPSESPASRTIRPGSSSTAEHRRLLQVLSPWSRGITLPFLNISGL